MKTKTLFLDISNSETAHPYTLWQKGGTSLPLIVRGVHQLSDL